MAEDSFFKGALGTVVEKVDAFTTTGQRPRTGPRDATFIPTSAPNAALGPRPAETKGRVQGEIESAADYYGPEIYKRLTFYSNFQGNDDALSNDFVPITQVKANPKMFVVGLIPPASNITGRLLDRSGSVGNVVGAPEDVSIGGSGARGGTLDPVVNGTVPGTGVREPTKHTPMNRQTFSESLLKVLPGATKEQAGILWAQFAGETGSGSKCFGWNLGNVKHHNGSSVNYQTLNNVWEGVTPAQAESLKATGQWVADPSADHAKVVGPGKVSVLVAPGKEGENQACWFNVYPSADVGMASFINSKKSGRYASSWQAIENGDPAAYAHELKKNGYYTASETAYANSLKVHYNAWLKDDSFEKAQQKAGITTETTNNKWQKDGSANASKSKEDETKTHDNGFRDKQNALGEKFMAAQQDEMKRTVLALETMKRTPPLRMLVNPASFKTNSEKIISDAGWTRNGPVIEHWGESQDKIEASGRVAGFFAIDANNPRADNEGGAPGLTRVARNFSAAYHNFLSLWLLYRNNANLLLDGAATDGGKWNRISMVGSIYIYYDDIMYIGSFDSFNVTESDDKPYTLEYDFSFTVRAAFLLDRPDQHLDRNARSNTLSTSGVGSTQLPSDSRTTGGGPVRLPTQTEEQINAGLFPGPNPNISGG